MNKLFTKIAGIALGLTMAVGVGVAVSSEKTAKEVNAASPCVLTTNVVSGTSEDGNISWTAIKGNSGTAPGIYNSGIRLYQNGGFIQLEAKNGNKINAFTAQNTSTYASTANYAISETAFSTASTPSNAGTNTSVAKGGTYTVSDLDSTYVAIICRGSDKNSRLEISSITVTYSSGSEVGVTGVTVAPTAVTLGVGATQQLTPTVAPDNATDKSVSYSSNATGIATVSADGLITAVAAGSAIITVTTTDGGYTATCAVTVTAPVAVTGVSLNKNSTSLEVGESETLVATVAPEDATNKAVTWSSDDEDVATIENGEVTAIAAGSATITATTVDGGFTATCVVTVTAPQTVTFVAGTDVGQTTESISKGGIAISTALGEGTFIRTDNYRVYSGKNVTIASSIGNMSKIEFACTNGYNNLKGTGYTKNGNDGTWLGDSSSVTLMADGAQARITEITVTIASSDPSVELAPTSATSVAMLKGDSDTSIKVLVNNIENPEWAFTYDEGEETGLATSSYVNVEASELDSNNIATLTVTTKANGSTILHIVVSEVVCSATVEITVSPKPQAGTMVAKLGGEVVTGAVECKTGEHVQFTFAAEDTDGGAYTVTAAALKATIVSGDAYGSLYGSTGVNGTAPGTVIARYALKVLESVYVDVTVNVLDDYLESVILETFAFNENLTAAQGESPTEAVFAVRNGLTHFGETQVIPFEDFRFSYTDEMGVAGNVFAYDYSHGEVYDATHKDQTIYVYCTLGNVKVGTYSVRVEQLDDPLTAITLTNVTEHAKSIDLGGSFQLEWSYTPTNPTDGKEVVFRLENETEGSEISVNETGLISAGKVAGATAKVIIESGHDDEIFDYVNVTVTMTEMTYKVGSADAGWVLVEDISTLSAGDQVILTGVKDEVTYAAGVYTSGNNVKADTAHPLTVSDNKVTGVEDSMVYTLETGSVAGSLAFKDSTGKYLYAAGGNGEGGIEVKNYLKAQSNIDGNASFLLNADGTVVAQGDCPNGYMRYNNSDSGQTHNNLFNCYKSTSTIGTLVTFYKLNANVTLTVDEDLYNAIYMNFGTGKTFTCDGDGKSFDATKWANAGAAITGLADFEDYMLNKAIANEDGNMIENFLAMYDYVIAKKEAGNKIYAGAADFLGRFEANGINHQVALTLRAESTAASDSTIKIIVIISLVSLTATLGCVLIRKRRTHR